MMERRENFRRRTLLDGRLEIEKLNGWVLDCTVRNVSDGGARLTLPTDVVVPRTVDLTISKGPKRPARLVWYREGHAGFALDERRVAPRPANDTPVPTTRLAARMAAITTKGQAKPRFTQA